jgi:arylsulfatase A-like enzyme
MPTFLDAAGVAVPGGLDGKSLLPLLRGQEDRVHDHLLFMGLESSTWGFQSERSALPKFVAMRLQEPGSWAVMTDRHLLRFTGTLPAGLYADHPDGLPARTELYDLPADPGEKNNLAESNPETVKKLRALMAAHAQNLPPPNRWNRKKWTELMESLPTP